MEARTELERFEIESGYYVLYTDKPKDYISEVILNAGGSIHEEGYNQENVMLVKIIFPAGTKVQEFDVPPERNPQHFMAADAYIEMPSARKLFFHMHGTSDRLSFAKS